MARALLMPYVSVSCAVGRATTSLKMNVKAAAIPTNTHRTSKNTPMTVLRFCIWLLLVSVVVVRVKKYGKKQREGPDYLEIASGTLAPEGQVSSCAGEAVNIQMQAGRRRSRNCPVSCPAGQLRCWDFRHGSNCPSEARHT